MTANVFQLILTGVWNLQLLFCWSHYCLSCPGLQEIAEPLFDLKLGMEQLAKNKTFKRILATLLAIGNFLNSSSVNALIPYFSNTLPISQ